MGSVAGESWAQIRQVVVGVPELAPATARAREAFGLAPGFDDPLLEQMGIVDDCMVLGDGLGFLEYVAPLRPDAGLARWLEKGGGPGGFAFSIQVPALEPLLARMPALGIEASAVVEAYGYRLAQLRPKALGMLIELDEVPDREKWFWDGHAFERPASPLVESFASLEITSPDPAAQAGLWGALLDLPVADGAGGAPLLSVGSVDVTFVEGERSYLSGIGLTRPTPAPAGPHTADGPHTVDRPDTVDGAESGSTLHLDGVRFDLL